MKRQKSCGPRLGKLVHQLPRVVTFAYDLRFRRMIAHWKGIIEEIHFGGSIMPLNVIENLYPKKPSFRPSKWPRKLKLLKIVNCQNCQKTVLSQLEKVGGHRYPPGSILIHRISLTRENKMKHLRSPDRSFSSKMSCLHQSRNKSKTHQCTRFHLQWKIPIKDNL
jgi:hypothetical protein